ncbi:MAG: hypothetical protein DRI46_13990 [Chloroflexi bacterium]|nr:MAG: hypothetical protein DRI46_13990 [Chloroflexota bacterium]
MARRKRHDSIDAQVQDSFGLRICPPDGTEFTDEELSVWKQVITTREEWRDIDLMLLVRLVRLEVKMRSLWEVIDSDKGVDSEVVKNLNSLHNQQLGIITKMHLMTQHNPRTLNKPAAKKKLKHPVSLLAKVG